MKMRRILLVSTLSLILYNCNSGDNTIAVANQTKKTTITDLKLLNFWNEYSIESKEYGTQTNVLIKNGERIMKTNALPNHPTGEFPNEGNPNVISAQKIEYKFPIKPKFTGKAKWAREPGVALNGVKFEPETGEFFTCETGEHYKVEAFQELIDLGLDDNHAHVQPTGAYHYHGVPTGLIKLLDKGEDLIHVGFAHDGFPIYYSKSGKYKPSYKLSETSRTGDICSYKNPKETIQKKLNETHPDGTFVSDWEYQKGLGDLDECNGIEINGKYMYFVTETYPYVGRCLMGEFTEERPKGPPPGAHHHGPPNHPPHRH